MIHLFLQESWHFTKKRTTKYVTVKGSKWHCSRTCVLVAVISLPSALPAFSVVMVHSVCLGAWSWAFCTSEDLDVKYFFEPKLGWGCLFDFCVHVDFIVFLWITGFESEINVLSIK